MTKRTTPAQPKSPYAEAARELAKKGRAHAQGKGSAAPPTLSTPERMVRALEVGGTVDYDTRRGTETPGRQTINAAPLDRFYARGLLSKDRYENERLYNAGNHFRFDWYLAGLNGYKGPSFDGGGPGAGFNPSGPSPFFADSAVDARKRYGLACNALSQTLRMTLESILCKEDNPEDAVLGTSDWNGKRSRQTSGIDRLRIGLEILADHYERRRGTSRVA